MSFIINFVESVQDSLRSLMTVPSKAPQAPPVWQLLYKGPVYLFVAWLGASLFEAVFNIFNAPLAEFPGPKLAAATAWYQTYYEVYRRESWTDVLERLHKQYGPIVRVGPNELHFSDPAAYHEIYNENNKWNKDAFLYRSFGQDHSSFGFLTYEPSKKRKDFLSPFFSHRAICDLQELIQSNVDRFCDVLTANNGKGRSSDLFLGLRCLSLDTIMSFCFARSVDALGEPEFKSPIVEAMEASLPASILFKHFNLIRKVAFALPGLSSWISPPMAGLTRLKKILVSQVREVTATPYSALEAPQKTIYNELLSPAATGGKKVNTMSLYEEAQALVFGGTDTTANTLMVGIFHMLEQPALVSRLRKELLEVWPVLEDVSPKFEELEKLPFLTAVIKESLRTGPTGIVSPLPRTLPNKATTINGSIIPAGTTLGMSGYFVHNSETIFKNPRDFDPTRWLEDASLDKWLVPFSKGPRMCLGQNLAYCELYLAFASIFRKFDLELDSARYAMHHQHYKTEY
ncbi:Cytochrome P450 monooxygenase yanH [Hyphodiscus hymeniophilus]|uniref:Cytochrome P450 monooxygenase yanH n=1 Tax=Hyphodiscus hymeniophilus TaxID=353542 RepID=A0A9P7AYK1_9HELO|nr:Cytochrome P450 monooxygenase yanH [Hyphodiscus hymeniophilus]